MRKIELAPLGGTDESLLAEVSAFLSATLKIPVGRRVLHFKADTFYDPARCQYNSTNILLALKAESGDKAQNGVTLLAVLPHDLFIPVLTFVFGEAELRGSVAVVSYHRFQNERYGLPANRKTLITRLCKVALHEVGHTRGLIHCLNPECVMFSSPDVEGIDNKGSRFCVDCSRMMTREMNLPAGRTK